MKVGSGILGLNRSYSFAHNFLIQRKSQGYRQVVQKNLLLESFGLILKFVDIQNKIITRGSIEYFKHSRYTFLTSVLSIGGFHGKFENRILSCLPYYCPFFTIRHLRAIYHHLKYFKLPEFFFITNCMLAPLNTLGGIFSVRKGLKIVLFFL